MTPDEYAALDAFAIAGLVNSGGASATEVHAAATAMHERTDPAIHAVVEWYDEPSGGADTGPLAGVPVLRKDYGSTEAGRLQEMGSRLCEGVRPPTTSPMFRRLAIAGARVVGRSAVPEFIMHGTTESLAFGTTRNPHDLTLSAGGSSGGAAAAVAAGVVPVAHASDCAGSIRIPAAACGVYGLKPTSRRVPVDQGDWGGIAVEFVLSRTMRDQHRFFGLLATGPFSSPPARLRVGFTAEHWAGGTLGPGVAEGVLRVAKVLEAAGHDVVPIGVPVDIEQMMRAWDVHFGRWVAFDAERWSAYTGRPADSSTLEPVTLAQIERVASATPAELTAGQLAADHAVAAMNERLADVDVVLSAVNDQGRLPLEELSGTVEDFDLYLQRTDEHFSSLFPANVSGRPSMAVPAGRLAGAPIGVQLMGRPGDDLVLLGLASQIEAAEIATEPLD